MRERVLRGLDDRQQNVLVEQVALLLRERVQYVTGCEGERVTVYIAL